MAAPVVLITEITTVYSRTPVRVIASASAPVRRGSVASFSEAEDDIRLAFGNEVDNETSCEFSISFWLKVTEKPDGSWRVIYQKTDASNLENRTPTMWLNPKTMVLNDLVIIYNYR